MAEFFKTEKKKTSLDKVEISLTDAQITKLIGYDLPQLVNAVKEAKLSPEKIKLLGTILKETERIGHDAMGSSDARNALSDKTVAKFFVAHPLEVRSIILSTKTESYCALLSLKNETPRKFFENYPEEFLKLYSEIGDKENYWNFFIALDSKQFAEFFFEKPTKVFNALDALTLQEPSSNILGDISRRPELAKLFVAYADNPTKEKMNSFLDEFRKTSAK